MKFPACCCVLLLLTASFCTADFDDGFPDVIKQSAFEEIIGNYYAFDPFLQPGLQPGRKGRELNNGHRHEQNLIRHTVPTFVPSQQVTGNLNSDPTLYSIPPAITSPDAKDTVNFEENSPAFVTRAPVTQPSNGQLTQFKQRPLHSVKNEDFTNLDTEEDYPQYPPFLTEPSSSVRQLHPAATSERSLPKYVIGIAGEEQIDEVDFLNTEPRSHKSREVVDRNQFVKRTRPVFELDESPFSRRSSRFVHFDGIPIGNTRAESADFNRFRRYYYNPSHDVRNSRNIQNGYYVASKVLWRTPVPDVKQYTQSSVPPLIRPSVYAD